jgi:hypothetical protein
LRADRESRDLRRRIRGLRAEIRKQRAERGERREEKASREQQSREQRVEAKERQSRGEGKGMQEVAVHTIASHLFAGHGTETEVTHCHHT